jgi:hypothetical protein
MRTPYARLFTSGDGRQVELVDLHLSYLYAGMEEGTPRLSWRVQALRLEAELARRPRGFLAVDLTTIQRMGGEANVTEWIPSERVAASLRGVWADTELDVVWFQQPEVDPLPRLVEIVRHIEWDHLARAV